MKKIKKIKKITEKRKLTEVNKISFVQKGSDKKKMIIYFLISFFISALLGYFILSKKTDIKKQSKKTLISPTQTIKKNNSSFTNQWFFKNQAKSNEIKNQLNQLSSIYIDPLDLINNIKKRTEKFYLLICVIKHLIRKSILKTRFFLRMSIR